MNSSEARIDLPFVVFTNSDADYRITVCAPRDVMPLAERIVERIARPCDPLIGKSSLAILGAIRAPDRTDGLLVFRAFDVGTFKGRPHTLGIVAVEVPAGLKRNWRISQLLGALPPPIPDSPIYSLPSQENIREQLAQTEPFRLVDSWEDSFDRRQPDMAEVFAYPADLCSILREFVRSVRADNPPWRSGRIKWGIMLAMAIIIGVAGIAAWRRSSPPLPVPPDNYDKSKLLSVLSDSGIMIMPSADADRVESILATTAETAERRLRALTADLSKHIDEPPGDSEPAIERHYQSWTSDLLYGEPMVSPPGNLKLREAIKTHRKYQETLRQLDQLTKLSRDGDEFERGLKSLRNLLGVAKGRENVID